MDPKNKYGIDWATQKGISYSQYSIFSNCQYQWYLSYGKKLRVFKPSIYLTFGTSFHEALQEYIKTMYEDSVKAADAMDLTEFLKERMVENYRQAIVENDNKHFSNQKEFNEFLEDGIKLLDWIKKRRKQYFSSKNVKLIGIEIPIKSQLFEQSNNIFAIGSIDLILRDETTKTYEIYDIKTSTRGWTDTEKKDPLKINQVLLYKHYYSEMLKVPHEDINVKFFIVKRRPFISKDFPTKLVQEFIPAQGKIKMKGAITSFQDFVKSCYDMSGKLIEREYPKNPSSCKYCPYSDRPDLCDKSVK